MALPFLEAMVPASTALAQTAAVAPRRFVGLWVCQGAAPGHWVPDQVGRDFEFKEVFKPLEPYRNHTTIISGLHARSAESPPGITGADHFVAAAYLCASQPKKTIGADVYVGTTIDQMIAQKWGQDNLMPSMQLAVEDPGANSSNCGEGYSCAYSNTISWSTPSTPLPMELNPQVVFERMFGDGSTNDVRARRRERDRSILDSMLDSFNRLRGNVSSEDKTRLDQYSNDIREIERRLQIAMNASVVTPEDMTVPTGVPATFDEHIKLQFDLLALAFKADITRVGTMIFARDLTGRSYPASEVPNMGFHGGSHHGEDLKRIADYAKLNKYHVQMVAYLVDNLSKTPEGDGTLLDHSLVLYGSNMGNSNQHLHYDVPHVVVGGAGGAKGNNHIAFPSKTVPTGNLLLSILDKFDIHQDSIGDSTGRFELS